VKVGGISKENWFKIGARLKEFFLGLKTFRGCFILEKISGKVLRRFKELQARFQAKSSSFPTSTSNLESKQTSNLAS
jgi:hypothetical protein